MSAHTGQRVVITAAAAGIGRVVAEAFVRAGAVVHLCDVNEAALDEVRHSLGSSVVASHVNLADAAAVSAWLDHTVASLGGVDVLINNAGIKGPTAMVEDVTYDEWRESLAVGLDTQFLTMKKIAPLMKAAGRGSIINFSSTAGQYGYGLRTPYAASKWAVIGLTKSVAVEVGPHGVRCNAICPGSVAGARIDSVIAAEAQQRGVEPSVVAAEYVQGQSIKRFVEPSEIADLCLFLASPASSMISGQALGIDGHTETFHL